MCVCVFCVIQYNNRKILYVYNYMYFLYNENAKKIKYKSCEIQH